ncbi:kinesin light chain [Diplogelasinospora grovesii]|uniref:Kinesin light chain n=1 Tax=Diplogelasinospora grovesii TaxID=303347 RepID=A0AAN6N661_9PEZI|nr:kinesin light chain [Diplogelasinospora grovesii]
MGSCLPWRRKAAPNPQSHANRDSGSSEGPRVPSPSRSHFPAGVQSPRRNTKACSSNAVAEAQATRASTDAGANDQPRTTSQRRRNAASGRATAPRPCRREDFGIAILCALPLEYDAVSLVLDDDNVYKTGRIGKHNVVLALLSSMGKASAASTAAGIRSRYHHVRLAFLSGVEEILLGDVVISKAIVQYDFGRQYPDRFESRDGPEDKMARPDKEFRTRLSTFETADNRQRLQKRTADFLRQLRAKATRKNYGAKYDYPGATEDKLFEPGYRHKHHTGSDPSSCDTLRCDEQYLVPRKRLRLKRETESEKAQEPAIHIGPSGEHRDGIARPKGIIAFEMEGAGVAEEIPCVIIKGNKKWQNFAAATAASALKAVLEHRERLIEVAPRQPHFFVPFGRNKDFLLERIPPSADKDDCQRTAIEGLGGVGKTQIALEAAFRVRDEHPDCHIFWVPANAYREIGRQLGIAGINDDKADVKLLVKTALSQSADNWLLILLFGTAGATPHRGSILFTTRNHEARGIVNLAEMSRPEAVDLLQRNVAAHQLSDTQSTASLLNFLADLPLAIKQASAYMAKTGITATHNERLIELLSKDFEDRARYKSTRNPVAATWLISFHHISRDNQLAAQYLRFMSFISEKEIPKAIGTLKAYAFITERAGQESYDIHRLVRLAMRNWLAENGELKACTTTVMQQLDEVFPFPTHESRAVCMRYLPHTLAALDFQDQSTDDAVKSSLLLNVAESSFMLGKYQDAEELYRQALKLRTQVLGAEHPSTLVSMNNLALVLNSQGKYEEAETLHRQALELSAKVFGAEHPSTLASINNLASVLNSQGKYEEAETMYRQALKLWTKVLGAEHPDTLASINNLASVLDSQGKYEEAETLHRQALELRTKVLGAEHPDTPASMNNLANVLYSQGNINNLANVLDSQGKYEEAETMYRQALKLRTKVLGAEHPDTLTSINNLASVLDSQGKYEEAETIHQQALKLRTKGKYEEAKTMYRQALELRTKVLGAEHPGMLASMDNLTNVRDS